MKALVLFLCVVGGLYGSLGNTLIMAGTKSIQSTNERILKAGV